MFLPIKHLPPHLYPNHHSPHMSTNVAEHPLGHPVPPYTEHAISVSLPTWADNVGYEEGDPRVLDSMQTGYPRFFIHMDIRKVSHPFWVAQYDRSAVEGRCQFRAVLSLLNTKRPC